MDEEDFLARYDLIGRPYVFRGEYAPSVHQKIAATSGLEAKPLASRVRTCIPKADALIHGREIKAGRVKVFRSWDKDNYMLVFRETGWQSGRRTRRTASLWTGRIFFKITSPAFGRSLDGGWTGLPDNSCRSSPSGEHPDAGMPGEIPYSD